MIKLVLIPTITPNTRQHNNIFPSLIYCQPINCPTFNIRRSLTYILITLFNIINQSLIVSCSTCKWRVPVQPFCPICWLSNRTFIAASKFHSIIVVAFWGWVIWVFAITLCLNWLKTKLIVSLLSSCCSNYLTLHSNKFLTNYIPILLNSVEHFIVQPERTPS